MTTTRQPSAAELRRNAETLARSGRTLVLATAQDGEAWAAPVYYLFDAWRFYFFSDPQSRHVHEALKTGRAAGTLFAEGEGWRAIQGLQMSGTVAPVTGKGAAARILIRYLGRFRLGGDFLGPNGDAPEWSWFRSHFKVDGYVFIPSRVLYLDNRVRFGFRTVVDIVSPGRRQ